MLRKERVVTIGEHEYRMRQLGALEGRKLWLKLVHILAPALERLAKEKTLDEAALLGGLSTLLERLDEATVESLYAAFGRSCELHIVDDKGERWPKLEGAVFDEHFAGNYLAMSQWLAEGVAFNFLPFGSDGSLGDLLATVRQSVAASKPSSPTTSTGSSGAS